MPTADHTAVQCDRLQNLHAGATSDVGYTDEDATCVVLSRATDAQRDFMIAAGCRDGAMQKEDFLPAAPVLSGVKTTRQLVKQMP